MALTNTEIAEALEGHINTTQTFIEEVVAWSVDLTDTVSFTDPQTQNPIVVASLWKIISDYQGLTGAEWATTPEDVLVPSGNLVDEYSCYHWFKKTEAIAAGVESVAGEVVLAQAAAAAAGVSETAAAASETNAATSESNAATSAATAASEASDAGADATAAAASASSAEDWATELEDVEVVTGKYSALHWAAKAEYWAGQANVTTLDALTDVNLAAKADGYIIYWNNTAGEYQFQDFSHTHVIADVTGLQSALDGKSATGHGHVIADITGLQTELDGKSATGHGHVIADVTGLQAALDGKSATGHLHTIANVTGLQTELDAKVVEAAPAFEAPVVLQLDSRSARGTGTETVIIGSASKVYLPVNGDNVTINLQVPVSNVLNGITDIFLTGSILVKATAAITGLSVTSDASDDDINNDDVPTVSGQFAIFKYEYFNDGTVEYLKGVWV